MVLPVVSMNVGDAYTNLRDAGVNARSYVMKLRDDLTTNGGVSGSFMLAAIDACVTTLELASNISANATLRAAIDGYVQQQTGNPNLDVHAEITSSMEALASLVGAMVSAYPKNGDGLLLDRSFDQQGRIVWATIPSASLSGTSAAITNWLATID